MTKKFSALLFGMLLCLAAPRARADDCILDRCADKAAPAPSVDLLTTDVYADGGWAWRN